MLRQHLLERAQHGTQSQIRAITRAVEAVGGVNLGQGTCPLMPADEVVNAAQAAIASGLNSYTLFDGVLPLKEAICKRTAAYNRFNVRPEQVLVTCGATGAFECVCKSFVAPGDEIVVFEPIYQYHIRQALERGATIKYVQLHPPHWEIDWEALRESMTPRTKMIVFSNPNNPTGKVFTRRELSEIGEICAEFDIMAVVDEVYEYILPDQCEHISLASLPGMFSRTLTLSSASKTFFVTGWRVGWLIGEADVMPALGVKADETYVCAPAPLQYAVAHGLGLDENFFARIAHSFHGRKKFLQGALKQAGFTPYDPAGAYYILAEYPPELGADDLSAARRLIDLVGVGAVPGYEFFPTKSSTGLLRFCFALPDDALELGCAQLKRLGQFGSR